MKSTVRICIAVFCILLSVSTAVQAQTSMKRMKAEVIEWIDNEGARFEQAASSIYTFAETAFREHKSAGLLADMLEEAGFSVERGVADIPTAFVAAYGSGSPVIGILAEYDALPGLSQKASLPYKEVLTPGAGGHGCGHNLFGAGSVEAAIAAAAVMKEHGLDGTIKLFGCPAEETLAGKIYMVNAGVFEGLDVCLNWHPSSDNRSFMARTLAMNNFTVEFYGKTAHGAADPWNGRSALDAVELMNSGVNYLREHVKPTVRIHYMIEHGGEAPNIVPEYAKVWYFVRDVDRAGVDHVYNRVLKCVEGAALMTETTTEVKLITGCYEYLPNLELSALLDRNLRLAGPPEFTDEEQAYAREMQKNLEVEEKGLNSVIADFNDTPTPGYGSTDCADVSWNVPTSGELDVAAVPMGVPWHSWAVASSSGSSAGFKAMHVAAKTLAASTIEALTDKKVIERAQAEFLESTKGFTYKCAIPKNQKAEIPEVE